MKFAMIPINRRYNGEQRVIRRVLISYNKKVRGVYKGTKIIELDPYFKNPDSSQQYVFEDDCFYLVKDGYDNFIQSSLLQVKRPYEYDAGKLVDVAIEFTASDLQQAIEMFNNRTEVH